MVNIKKPEDIIKIDRTEWADFLNTTPGTDNSPTWSIIGVGIADKSTEYNPEISEEKWVIYKNKIKELESYAPGSSVEQTAYKGDPVFEYIDNLRYRLKTGTEAETQLLEVDVYSVSDTQSSPKYRARLWNVVISVESNGGEKASINYSINYKGDPKFGTVTFTSGVPTFTEEDEE